MNLVLEYLAENRQRLELDRYHVPTRLSCVLVTPRFRASRHVVFLVLPEGQSEPVLVAKVSRLAGLNTGVEREAANLQAAQASRPLGFDSIPRLVAYESYRGQLLLVETALTGALMDPGRVRADLPGRCQAALEWLEEFHLATQFPSEQDPGWFGRLVEGPMADFEAVFPLSTEDRWLLEQTAQLARPLRDLPMPLVFEHGDFSHPNLFLTPGGQLRVVDWEIARPRGLPALDLFFFLTYAAFASLKAAVQVDYLAAFDAAFFGPGAWAAHYIQSYARQLHLPLPALPALFVLCWMRYSTSLIDRLQGSEQDGSAQAIVDAETASWLRSNRFYALWRHTLTHLDELALQSPVEYLAI